MKNRSLRILTIFLVVTIALVGFSGCSKKTDIKKIGMVLSTLNNPFFVSMKEGAEKKAKDLGYEIVILDSQNDFAKERSNVQDLVQKGVGSIIINPIDSQAVKNSIKIANDSKIPVITVDRQIGRAHV